MKRNDGRESPSESSPSKAGPETSTGQGRPHKGWQSRGWSSRTSSGGGKRSPLGSLENGEATTNGKTESLRPYTVPYSGTTNMSTNGKKESPAGTGVTLRCMYTNQKAKKRKVWSDGAVKCCPSRQRVCLYRWSDVLGITEKLLGEIYLSAPEYEAFVTKGEPELEMELYLVSLDGVIQDEPSGDEHSAADAPSKIAGLSAGANCRKRRLLKPFKPPTRRAPPVLPPAPTDDASWERRGRLDQFGNGDRRSYPGGGASAGGDPRGALPARSSYTGFGHVESLWDTSELDREEDGLGSPGGAATSWEVAARREGGGSAHGDRGGGGARTFADARSGEVQAMLIASSASAAAGGGGPTWGQESVREGRSSTPFRHGFVHERGHPSAFRPTGIAGGHAPVREEYPGDDWASAGEDRHRATSHDLESLETYRGEGAWPTPADDRSQEGVDGGLPADNGCYGHHPDEDNGGANEDRRVDEGTFGPSVVGSGYSDGEHAPYPCPAAPDGGEGRMRSTQDILSLFGGFGEAPPPDVSTPHPSQEGNLAGVTLARPRRPDDLPPAAPHAERDAEGPERTAPEEQAQGAFVPAGGGKGRAADMRRAQKAARVAGTTTAGTLRSTDEAGAETTRGSDRGACPDWACGVCGVRGSAAATSCRVCGAERRASGGDGGGRVGDGGWGDASVWGGDECDRDDDANAPRRRIQQRLGEGADNENADRSDFASCSGSGDTPRGGEAHDARGSGATVGGASNGSDVEGQCRSAPICDAQSPAGGGREQEGVGTVDGSVASSTLIGHRTVGVRMQIDLGPSSDSEES